PVYGDVEHKELKIYKDNSEVYKGHAQAVVDKVWKNIHSAEGYPMIKTRIRSERVPRIGDKFCIGRNADVLTYNGWKNITLVTMQDKVATLDQQGNLKYDHPIDIYKFAYNGGIYKLRSKYVDLDVTMDHELYVKKKGNTN